MNPFPTCQITVLKTLYHQDLADEYRRPDVHQGPCPFFTVGDQFTVEYLAERPEEFKCDWARHDIHKIIMILMTKGDFSTWMKNENNVTIFFDHHRHPWAEQCCDHSEKRP